jgi:hypothetical protein
MGWSWPLEASRRTPGPLQSSEPSSTSSSCRLRRALRVLGCRMGRASRPGSRRGWPRPIYGPWRKNSSWGVSPFGTNTRAQSSELAPIQRAGCGPGIVGSGGAFAALSTMSCGETTPATGSSTSTETSSATSTETPTTGTSTSTSIGTPIDTLDGGLIGDYVLCADGSYSVCTATLPSDRMGPSSPAGRRSDR